MSRHDEHGQIVDDAPEHGPEWWAMDGEWCVCGCSAGVHVTVNGKPASSLRELREWHGWLQGVSPDFRDPS